MQILTGRQIYKQYKEYNQKELSLCGWVRSNRDSRDFGFLVINDGTFFEPIQIVYGKELSNFTEVKKLSVGTAVIVKGILTETPDARQPFEIQAESVEVEGESPSDYPLQKKRHSFEYLRTIAHLRPRANTFQAVYRVRSLIAYAIHKFFMERDFVYVHTPIISGQDCEGAGEMFQVTTLDLEELSQGKKLDYREDFFERETSLTVSGQLNGEAFAQAFRNIFQGIPEIILQNSRSVSGTVACHNGSVPVDQRKKCLVTIYRIVEEFLHVIRVHITEQISGDISGYRNRTHIDKGSLSVDPIRAGINIMGGGSADAAIIV